MQSLYAKAVIAAVIIETFFAFINNRDFYQQILQIIVLIIVLILQIVFWNKKSVKFVQSVDKKIY
jgi:hypothetical protein